MTQLEDAARGGEVAQLRTLTMPSPDLIEDMYRETPADKYPSRHPFAVVHPGALSAATCDELIRVGERNEAYRHPACDATSTREFRPDQAPYLAPLAKLARDANRTHWQYDLRDGQQSWMHTYERGSSYERHLDYAIGSSRKLTAVAFLSDEDAYIGGGLWLTPIPGTLEAPMPRQRGTVVVFPPMVLHYVASVVSGKRQTINMGFWGPPFR